MLNNKLSKIIIKYLQKHKMGDSTLNNLTLDLLHKLFVRFFYDFKYKTWANLNHALPLEELKKNLIIKAIALEFFIRDMFNLPLPNTENMAKFKEGANMYKEKTQIFRKNLPHATHNFTNYSTKHTAIINKLDDFFKNNPNPSVANNFNLNYVKNFKFNFNLHQYNFKEKLIYNTYRNTSLNLDFALQHSNHCLICHNRKKDSCSNYAIHNNINLSCPLEQDISVMHYLFRNGFEIAALAVIMQENPLVLLTGHRICNNCVAGCIFVNPRGTNQIKAVDTPLSESVLLNRVLQQSVQIYFLLTLFNPLKNYNTYANLNFSKCCLSVPLQILIVGAGPAGLVSAYYFAYAGYRVVLADALMDNMGNNLGGVLNYGVTHRWNKKNLKLMLKILKQFSSLSFINYCFSLHSQIIHPAYPNQRWHFIIWATGASKPKFLPQLTNYLKQKNKLMPNNCFSAPKFLMEENLKIKIHNGLQNLIKAKLPNKHNINIVVVGTGLTAIDTVSELAIKYANHAVKIVLIINTGLYQSRAYQQMPKEVLALQLLASKLKNITIICAKLLKFLGKLNSISYLIIQYKNKIVKCKVDFLLFAVGMQKNIPQGYNFIKDFFVNAWGQKIWLVGDASCKQQFSGSVVKAMAHAKQICSKIIKLSLSQPMDLTTYGHTLSMTNILNVQLQKTNAQHFIISINNIFNTTLPLQMFKIFFKYEGEWHFKFVLPMYLDKHRVVFLINYSKMYFFKFLNQLYQKKIQGLGLSNINVLLAPQNNRHSLLNLQPEDKYFIIGNQAVIGLVNYLYREGYNFKFTLTRGLNFMTYVKFDYKLYYYTFNWQNIKLLKKTLQYYRSLNYKIILTDPILITKIKNSCFFINYKNYFLCLNGGLCAGCVRWEENKIIYSCTNVLQKNYVANKKIIG